MPVPSKDVKALPKPPAEKPLKEKLTVLLSFNGTLLHFAHEGKQYITEGRHDLDVVTHKGFNGKPVSDIVFKRPYLRELLDYITDHSDYFNLGFITQLDVSTAKGIYDMLCKYELRCSKKNKKAFEPYLFIATDLVEKKNAFYDPKENDSFYEKKFSRRVLYDVLNKKKIDIPFVRDFEYDINHLMKLPYFKDKLNPKRTVYIDVPDYKWNDRPIQNTILIEKWKASMTCDDTLKKIMTWLEKHKHEKAIDQLELPNYMASSPFNKIDNVPQYGRFYNKAIAQICAAKKAGRTRGRPASESKKTKKAKK